MDVSFVITCDINKPQEASLFTWLSQLDVDVKQQRIKDALLTGYYVMESGITEYYQHLYDHHLKEICEKDMMTKLCNVEQEKNDITAKLMCEKEALQNDYEGRLNMFARLNRELQERLEWFSKENLRIKEETVAYYEDKMNKQIALTDIENKTKHQELVSLVSRLQDELKSVRDEESVKYRMEIDMLKSQYHNEKQETEYFKKLMEEKDIQLKDAFKNETKERILNLEAIIQQKDAELATLKTCNFVKGMTGENLLMNFFREQYPKLMINHTGKTAHEGDIQLVDTMQDTIIVIESKYKQSIDRNDVEKFCRDVSNVSQKDTTSTQCIGGLFVSLLTRNIPGKGDAYFEMIGNVPVMYVGFSNTEEFSVYFKRYVDMYFELCKFFKQQGAQKSSVNEVLEEVGFYFNMLVKNKTRIEDFKTNCLNKLNKFVTDIETDNKLLINRVEGVLKKNNSLKYDNVHCCERCGEIFSNKRLHNKHIKSCEA